MKFINLFVGITTYNDEQWVEPCISSLKYTLQDISYQLFVLDNKSSDKTVARAQHAGAKVISVKCSQGDALNILLNQSQADYTLLVHSDVVFLVRGWFDLFVERLNKSVVCLSPEDIGLGNYLRTYGKGMPESSLMFFKTDAAKKLRHYSLSCIGKALQKPGIFPLMLFDFYGPHVTHCIPDLLEEHSLDWHKMAVWPSRRLSDPWFEYNDPKANWQSEWGYFEYGFGNFYSIDHTITHYHNWYSRQIKDDIRELNQNGVPLAFIREYSRKFLEDYKYSRVNLPELK